MAKVVGHLNLDESRITPMAMVSGEPLSNLYQIVELENNVVLVGEANCSRCSQTTTSYQWSRYPMCRQELSNPCLGIQQERLRHER